mmetsp:Transcript_44171/g.102028  ORF Transcript_44171/g.102028 Transcript_44171/m.102028 type:complete len:203 (-) Transcript_44171:895-1503(-)
MVSTPLASTTSAIQGFSSRFSSRFSRSPALRMFSRPLIKIHPSLLSKAVSASTIGGTQPSSSTKRRICSVEPPEVAFANAQATSFFTSKEALRRSSNSGGTSPASSTSWICARLPAKMLEIAQQLSFWMLRFVWPIKTLSCGSTPADSTCCVWLSSPETMLPTVRSVGVCTRAEGWASSSMQRRSTPVLRTAAILSLGPSEM